MPAGIFALFFFLVGGGTFRNASGDKKETASLTIPDWNNAEQHHPTASKS